MGVDFVCRPGVVTALIGPNSCGKSTLLKCLLGLVIADQGRLAFDNFDISQGVEYREKLGYLPQIVDFPENLTVTEILELLESLRSKKAIKKDLLLGQLELGGLLNHAFGELSGGARQKLGAACALMFDPDYILLDEPTASLDPQTALAFREIISGQANRGKTVLLVSHNLSEVEQVAQEIVFLLEGKVQYFGSVKQFMNGSLNLESALVNFVTKRKGPL